MIAEVNGIRLYYETVGRGRPLLLLHGNGEDHTIFEEAVSVLADRFRCYLIDSRGHGKSSPCEELHYENMAADAVDLILLLNLDNVVLYGFSDGGIAGLLAAARCERITTLIVSGANVTPRGVKLGLRLSFLRDYLKRRDPKTRLMLEEPHISDGTLRGISARTLVLAGSADLIREKETRHIAGTIPGAELRILEGEDHGSYVCHSEKIGRIIREFTE